jgi:hypothetical protein
VGDRRRLLGERTIVRALLIVIGAGVLFLGLQVARAAGWLDGLRNRWARSMAHPELNRRQFGTASAKVDVLVILPLSRGCHGLNVEYMANVAAKYPHHLRVKFLEVKSEEGRSQLDRLGLERCASVIINGSNQCKDASGRAFTLAGPPFENYTVEDLRAVLQCALDTAYGVQAPRLPPSGWQRLEERQRIMGDSRNTKPVRP